MSQPERPPAPNSSAPSSSPSRRAPFLRWDRTRWRLRGGERRLSELDDRLLRDVGLDRGVVETPERPDRAVALALRLWLLGRVP